MCQLHRAHGSECMRCTAALAARRSVCGRRGTRRGVVWCGVVDEDDDNLEHLDLGWRSDRGGGPNLSLSSALPVEEKTGRHGRAGRAGTGLAVQARVGACTSPALEHMRGKMYLTLRPTFNVCTSGDIYKYVPIDGRQLEGHSIPARDLSVVLRLSPHSVRVISPGKGI
jgi:hypothetical protein